VAVVDPELTLDLPPSLTASTGMDALAQLVEPFVSCRAQPMTDALCREGIPRVARALPRAFADGADLRARSDMALGALWSGIALANAGLGAVHGFAAAIGGAFDAPHGAVCAALMPGVVELNARAVRASGRSEAADRFAELARLLTGRPAATIRDAVARLFDLKSRLAIPPLRAYGVKAEHVARLVEKALGTSSMKGNPVPLPSEALQDVLSGAL
jgi:alcohol dehydrogenase class IV